MNRTLWFTSLGALLIAALVLPPLSVGTMPEVVAAHFGAGGNADAFMTRPHYLGLLVALAVGLPVVLVAVVALAAERSAPLFRLPSRAYWFAPARRAASSEFLRDHVVRLGCVLVLFFAGMHGLMLQANAQHPPHLPMPGLAVLLTVFGLAMLAWKIALWRRFRLPA